jgi:hypothetical protein
VREIKEWPSSGSIFEVRNFHGLASCYRKFIRNFSGICTCMLDIVKKKHKYFSWTKEAESSFKVFKEKIIEQPILVLLDFGKTFQVRCDESGLAIGVVLSRDTRPFAYFSEKINDTKNKYSTYEK